MATLIGDKYFKEHVYTELLPALESEQKLRIIRPDITVDEITAAVARAYETKIIEL